MSERIPFPLSVRVDEQPLPASSTCSQDTGPNVMVLATALPAVGLRVQSVYVGHRGTPTQATHLQLGPAGTVQTIVCSHSEHAIPVWFARGRCLLDHLAQLQRFGAQLGHTIAVDVPDDAMAAVQLPHR